MSVTYDPSLGDRQFEEIDFYDRKAIVKFHAFQRDDSGGILVLEKKIFDYFQDASGQWFRRGEGDAGPTPVTADDVEYQDMIYWSFEIVSPPEFAGKFLPFRGALKGIVVKLEADGLWHFNLPRRSLGLDDAMYMVGMYVVAKKCGLDLAALDGESEMFDPDYVAEGVSALSQIVQAGLPLKVTDVLEHLIERKLKEAAEAGLLLEVKTGEKRPNSQSPWIGYGSISALTPAQAARFQAAAEAGQDQAEALRDQVRGMIPTEGIERQEFLKRVYDEASAIHPGLPSSGMLAELNATELQQLADKLAPRTPEEEEEMTL